MRDDRSLRIGVLPPGSNFVPFLADDLLAALEFGLADAQLDAKLVVEFAGYNADLKVVLPKVQHLLVAERVACVVAPLNCSVVEKLAPEFDGRRVPLIALSLGEDPLFQSAAGACVFVNSFHLWQSAWMGGYEGARRFGPRAAAMVALHEGGYNLSFAFQLGLEAAGGTLIDTAVTHTTSSGDDPSPHIARIAAYEPNFIWAGYSGKEAVSFLTAYHASGCKEHIPLLGLLPMVDEHVREAAGAAALGVCFVTPRPPRNDAADSAIRALTRSIGREPHPYAVLAYESLHLIAAAARTTVDHSPQALGAALRHVEVQGPRGAVRFDDGTGIDAAFCLRTVTSGDDAIECVDAPPLLNEQSLLARERLVKHGWVNPYLCA
jgi:branched-chain amino acid transport system substrate-binding protein